MEQESEGVSRVHVVYTRDAPLSTSPFLCLFCTSPIVGAYMFSPGKFFSPLAPWIISLVFRSRLSLSSFYAPRLLFSIGLSNQLDVQNVLCCVHGRESSPRSLAHTRKTRAAPNHPPSTPSIKSAAETEFSAPLTHLLNANETHCSPIDRAQI